MKKIFVILSLIMGLFMIAGCALKPKKSSSEQLQYVKNHEEELVKFVSSYNEGEIDSVQFQWGTADVSIKANGLPQGDGYLFTMNGAFNNREHTAFRLAIPIDDDGDPDLDEMYFLTEPSKDGKTLPDTSFSKELQYLKDSEEALVRFVKSYNEDEIHSVKFNWDTAEMRDVVDGTEEGAGKAIQLYGTFNDSDKNGFEIRIWLDDHGTPDVTRIEFLWSPSKNGKTLPEKTDKPVIL